MDNMDMGPGQHFLQNFHFRNGKTKYNNIEYEDDMDICMTMDTNSQRQHAPGDKNRSFFLFQPRKRPAVAKSGAAPKDHRDRLREKLRALTQGEVNRGEGRSKGRRGHEGFRRDRRCRRGGGELRGARAPTGSWRQVERKGNSAGPRRRQRRGGRGFRERRKEEEEEESEEKEEEARPAGSVAGSGRASLSRAGGRGQGEDGGSKKVRALVKLLTIEKLRKEKRNRRRRREDAKGRGFLMEEETARALQTATDRGGVAHTGRSRSPAQQSCWLRCRNGPARSRGRC